MNFKISIIEHNSENYKGTLEIRQKYLRQPLGMNIYEEDLESEKNQIHFAALLKEPKKIVGVVIMQKVENENYCKLRQMVVDEEFRGLGIGTQLVQALENYARESGLKQVVLHSRKVAVEFYSKLGYELSSDEFLEVGIPHYKMIKNL